MASIYTIISQFFYNALVIINWFSVRDTHQDLENVTPLGLIHRAKYDSFALLYVISIVLGEMELDLPAIIPPVLP